MCGSSGKERLVPLRCLGHLAVACAVLVGTAPAADLAEIRASGKLRALVVDGSPAFYALKAGGPGLDREILEGFGRLHKLALETVEVASWADLVPGLLEDRGDVAAGGVTVTPARSARIDFTVEVMPTRNVVVNRKPAPPIASLESLKAEKVGTVKGSSMAEALAAAGVRFDDGIPSGGAPEALRSGRITATLSGIEDALLYRRSDPAIQIGAFVGDPGRLAYGVRKDAPALKRALDDYLSNLRRTQTWGRLVVKYFGDAAPELLKRARGE
jgi:ABC-type amino acid transport substrate-binding protein